MIKAAFKKIFLYFFQNSDSVKNLVFSTALNYLRMNRGDFEYFFKDMFVKESERFPSLLNNGYLHIDKAIALARFLKLSPDRIIIDVGAAMGVTPVLFAKAFPASEIYAFEPLPATFVELKKAIAAFPSIHAINKAMGNENKQVDINIVSRATSSSLLTIDSNLSNEFWKIHLEEKGTVAVSMNRMDHEIPANKNVAILKMDVQGYEMEVLKGGVDVLKRTAIILIEMQNHELYTGGPKYYELDEHLRKSGFVLFDIIPSVRQENKIYEWDAIYINNKHA